MVLVVKLSRYIGRITVAFGALTALAAPAQVALSPPGQPSVTILTEPVDSAEQAQAHTDNPDTTQSSPDSRTDTTIDHSIDQTPGAGINEPVESGPGDLTSPEPAEPSTGDTEQNPVAQFVREIATTPCDTSDPEVRIIDSTDDLADINNPDIRIFCVEPGDYRDAGTVSISSSGTADTPRILRHIDDWPETQLNAVQQQRSAQAVFLKIRLTDASHWIVDGISVLNTDPAISLANRSIDILNGSADNIIHRSLVEGGRVAVRIHGSNRNLLQNNVIRNTVVTNGDSNCINIEGDPGQTVSANLIIGNEAYDCTDSLQLVTLADSKGNLTFPGTLIANNDFYLTDAMYTDCTGQRNPNGNCSVAEGRFDIKGGGTGPSDDQNLRVIGNRIWGARATDTTQGGSSWGSGIDICCGEAIGYVTIKDNIVMNSDRGISIGADNTHSITIANNTIYNIGSTNNNSGHALLALDKTYDTVWTENVIVDSAIWGMFLGSQQTVSCNTVIDSPRSRTSSDTLIGGNYYYGDVQVPNNTSDKPDIFMGSAALSANESLCFTRKRLTGPEQICIPFAQQSLLSPHSGACAG